MNTPLHPSIHYFYVPPTEGGGGHIVFGADPVGVFGTDGRILTKLAQIHCWEGGTS